METDLPKRKHPRLKEYDYGRCGAYFVTICTQERRCILSRIVGRGLAPAAIELTQYGEIARKHLFDLHNRYPYIKIIQFVIMPNHIHFVLFMELNAAGASPRPTLFDIICSYKSLVTRDCKRVQPIDKVFQTSFYEHIIRNRQDYDDISRYIKDNPARWYYDELYSE